MLLLQFKLKVLKFITKLKRRQDLNLGLELLIMSDLDQTLSLSDGKARLTPLPLLLSQYNVEL